MMDEVQCTLQIMVWVIFRGYSTNKMGSNHSVALGRGYHRMGVGNPKIE